MIGDSSDLVRVAVGNPPDEFLWAELVRMGQARIQNIPFSPTVSYGDVVRVVGMRGYDGLFYAAETITRGSRRVSLVTSGTDLHSMERVSAYLRTWPIKPGHSSPAEFTSDGFCAGLVFEGSPLFKDDEWPWALAFPFDTARKKASAFLDACPGVKWHGLTRRGETRKGSDA